MLPEADEQQQQEEPTGGRWQRNRPLLLLLALVALVVWEASATLYQHLVAPPTDQGWKDAVGVVKQHRRSADAPVLFAPLWVEPLGRFRFGSMLSDLKLATLSDVDRFSRVWEVSIRGVQHPWLAGKTPKKTWNKGGVQVALYEQQPAKVTFDFHDRLAEAQVDRIGEKLVRCRRTMVRKPGRGASPKFVCDPRRSWNWVGWHLAEVGHRPYRCIYAHPVDSHTMRIGFPAVPIGKKLVLYTGIDDFENRKRAKAPVLLQVQVGDKIVGTIKHVNDMPWHRTELDTSSQAGKTTTVRFEITTPLAYSRTFCFTGNARR